MTGFTPRILMYEDSAERFWRDYPDGYLITLVRHPAAWYASAREHGYTDELPQVMDQWRASTDASFRAKERRPDRVIVLRFEDLVLRAEAVMRTICHSTGLTFERTLTEPTFNTRSTKSNSQFNSADHVDRAAVDRYQQVLPDTDIDRIESMVGALYQRATDYVASR